MAIARHCDKKTALSQAILIIKQPSVKIFMLGLLIISIVTRAPQPIADKADKNFYPSYSLIRSKRLGIVFLLCIACYERWSSGKHQKRS
jgi:hypothetical protein